MASPARAEDDRRYTSGWAPYWLTTDSLTSFTGNVDLFEELSPFWFQAEGAPDTITPHVSVSAMTPLVAAGRAAGVPVLPSITDGHGPGGLAAILADDAARARHIDAIVALVVTRGYDGIDLDYEGFAFSDGRDTWATTRPNWVRFVRELAAELHERERLLSVTVPPIWADGTRGYTVYAWDEIGPSVDRLRIMTYDWSWSAPGPIAPIWWVLDTIEYAASVVPLSKVQIGLPAYGREWTRSAVGTCPPDQLPATESHTLEEIPDLVARVGATPTRDPVSGEMTFRYTRRVETYTGAARRPAPRVATADVIERYARPSAVAVRLSTCVVTREVWYPDAAALAERATAATNVGAGTAIWALGYETPVEWAALRGVAGGITGPSGTAPIGAIDAVRRDGDRVVVRGWALDPEGDLPIVVRITSTSRRTGASVTTTALARGERTDVATTYPGAGEFHGYRASAALTASGSPSGSYDVCVSAVGRYTATPPTNLGCRRVSVR